VLCRGCITVRVGALFEAEVLAMMLWDDVGGRTWVERAGPRTEVREVEPWRRRRLWRISRSRSTAPAVADLLAPERPG
jgi:hypothetical protein